MSSIKKQRYKANQFRKIYSTKQKKEGMRDFSPPPSLLTKDEILVVCLQESTSSFGLVGEQTKTQEALNTSWFGFNQDDLLFCVKKLIHLEKQKINEANKQIFNILGKEIPIQTL